MTPEALGLELLLIWTKKHRSFAYCALLDDVAAAGDILTII